MTIYFYVICLFLASINVNLSQTSQSLAISSEIKFYHSSNYFLIAFK